MIDIVERLRAEFIREGDMETLVEEAADVIELQRGLLREAVECISHEWDCAWQLGMECDCCSKGLIARIDAAIGQRN
jgi:hypothetical protein